MQVSEYNIALAFDKGQNTLCRIVWLGKSRSARTRKDGRYVNSERNSLWKRKRMVECQLGVPVFSQVLSVNTG